MNLEFMYKSDIRVYMDRKTDNMYRLNNGVWEERSYVNGVEHWTRVNEEKTSRLFMALLPDPGFNFKVTEREG